MYKINILSLKIVYYNISIKYYNEITLDNLFQSIFCSIMIEIDKYASHIITAYSICALDILSDRI